MEIGSLERRTNFQIFLFFIFRVMKKKQCGRQVWNAVEHEPVETRVLNPTASEASYEPKQRSCGTTNLKKKFWRRIVPAPKCPAPNRRRRNVPDPSDIASRKIVSFYNNLSSSTTEGFHSFFFELHLVLHHQHSPTISNVCRKSKREIR